jgi:hypothetical protein
MGEVQFFFSIELQKLRHGSGKRKTTAQHNCVFALQQEMEGSGDGRKKKSRAQDLT